jgi:SNF2 family DNA or RNA helicase
VFLIDAKPPVMIVSYETLRTLQEELAKCPIGLLLADEGHRLKNAGEYSFLPWFRVYCFF